MSPRHVISATLQPCPDFRHHTFLRANRPSSSDPAHKQQRSDKLCCEHRGTSDVSDNLGRSNIATSHWVSRGSSNRTWKRLLTPWTASAYPSSEAEHPHYVELLPALQGATIRRLRLWRTCGKIRNGPGGACLRRRSNDRT